MPAAIVSHPYGPPDANVRFFEGNGFIAELLPWSWYYPQGTCAIVVTMNEDRAA